MSRRRTRTVGLALFPFLSVLICAVGTVVVVFAGMTLTGLEATEQTFVVSIRETRERATGEAWEREPIYVVCDRAGLTVYRSATEVFRIPAAVLASERGELELLALADSMDRLRQQRWPVLFVKPSGVSHMSRLYAHLRARGVRVGKWAFAEGSTIVCEEIGGGAGR